MDQNLQNNLNPNQIPQGGNVAQKHAQFVNGVNSQQNVAAQSPSSHNNPPQQYINPNNFQKVLGVNQTPVSNPQSQRSLPQAQNTQQNPQLAPQDFKGAVPQMPVDQFYKTTQPRPQIQNTQTTRTNNDIIKLVIYAVPIIAIFIHLLRSIDDEDVLWHSRQSLVGQGLWFAVLIILRFIDAPIISNYGPMLVNIAAYGLLVFAGIKAYEHQRYNIPVVYDIGKNFIDGNK